MAEFLLISSERMRLQSCAETVVVPQQMPFLDYEAWLFVTKVYKKKTSSQKIFIFWFQLLYPVVFPFKRISERFICILLWSFIFHLLQNHLSLFREL